MPRPNSLPESALTAEPAISVTVAGIKAAVCQCYGLKETDMVSPERSRRVSHPRQVAMYLADRLTHLSRSEIGRRFGGRDHTTVMYACREVPKRLKTDAGLRQEVAQIVVAAKHGLAPAFMVVAGCKIRRDAMPSFWRQA